MQFLQCLNSLVWGVPALILILGVGLYFSIRTGFVQIRLFPKSCKAFLGTLRGKKNRDGTVTPFQALCTALAATVGTGNLAGVAGAIAIGGPGAIFWMWVCALLGMVIKFAEATLAVYYRQKQGREYVGGPMYMITSGMHRRWHFLAYLYCFFGVVATFGVGNATQVNAVITGMNQAISAFGGRETMAGNLIMGLLLAGLIAGILFGGMARIGKLAEKMIPFASLAYLLMGFGVLIARAPYLSDAFYSIFQGAFSPSAITGGVIGSVFVALRVGVSRGVFTNEAGMGTASIAHASAEVSHPVEQGLMGIMEVFLDTIVICTMTALVILVSGIPIPYGKDVGVALTTLAFASVYGNWVSIAIAVSLCLFAIATVLGWGLYGARCAQFLFGEGVWKWFVCIQAVTVFVTSFLKTDTVWLISETVNGLMAIPNLIALVVLSPKLFQLMKDYKTRKADQSANGGTYENFHQCESLRTVTYAKIPSPCSQSKAGGKADFSFEYRSAGYCHTGKVL